ncbi:hypothetical protein JCM6882_000622 [Rhodosporidiobolus microsporus]
MASSLTTQMGGLTLTGGKGGGGPGGGGGGGGGGPMRRPGFGRNGTPVKVYVNAFQVAPADMVVYHYDVEIGPTDEKRPARLNRAIWAHFVETQNPFGGVAVAYDSRAMAYSPRRLPADEGSFSINLPEADGSVSRGNHFTIKISFIRPIQLGALRAFVSGGRGAASVNEAAVMSAIQALNVVIQHGPMLVNPSRGPSFFLRGNNPQSALGLEIWRGYFSSLRPGIGNVFVNLDLSTQPMFAPGNLADVILELARLDSRGITARDLASIPPYVLIKLNRMIKGLRITRTVPDQNGRPAKRKIKQLDPRSAQRAEFQLADGTTTTVAAYFAQQYRVHLRHPEWPCVLISKRGLWPIELCVVDIAQKYGKKLNPEQVTKMLQFTTLKPQPRLDLIKQGIDRIFPQNNAAFAQWKLNSSRQPMQVTARILPPPSVTYKRPVNPQDGQWNLRGQTFSSAASIDRWMVFDFGGMNTQEIQQSITGLVSQLQALGVRVSNPRPQIHQAPRNIRADQVQAFIRSKVKPPGTPDKGFQPPQLIVAYLATKPSPFYAPIKHLGDMLVGCATQCLNIPKARKGNPQYYANVALKVNVKLGGVNATKNLGMAVNKPTIVFGLDVSHPAPGSLAPSVVGVVASMDKTITKYASRIGVQSSREEVIRDLAPMVNSLLVQFKDTVRVKPERLIVFRDGVSEGQFAHVLDHEVNAIRVACQKISPDFRPAITYLVCGKRHHISLFPAEAAASDRTGNVKAGTTVDKAIVNPFTFDWYTLSHGSLLGTSRSSHYTCLVDDSNLSADALQQLAYNICYTFQRCTRSVSYATPAYYADLLCGRAALLLGSGAGDDDTASQMSGGQGEQAAARLLADYRGRLGQIHPNHATSLFFL